MRLYLVRFFLKGGGGGGSAPAQTVYDMDSQNFQSRNPFSAEFSSFPCHCPVKI